MVKHRSAARGEPPSIRVKRLLTVFCATAGRAPYVPHPMAKSGHERSQAGMCCHGQRNLSTAHFRRSQAGLPAQRWWSGAGSNCRPSAFQEVYHPERTYLEKALAAQLTRIGAADGLFSVPLTCITSVPECAVSSVGFLWGSAAVSLSCGASVGLAEPPDWSGRPGHGVSKSCRRPDPDDHFPGNSASPERPARLW